MAKKGINAIMSPGRTVQNTAYDDLELLKAKERGKYSFVAVFSRLQYCGRIHRHLRILPRLELPKA